MNKGFMEAGDIDTDTNTGYGSMILKAFEQHAASSIQYLRIQYRPLIPKTKKLPEFYIQIALFNYR